MQILIAISRGFCKILQRFHGDFAAFFIAILKCCAAAQAERMRYELDTVTLKPGFGLFFFSGGGEGGIDFPFVISLYFTIQDIRRLMRIQAHPPTHKMEIFFLSVTWRPAKVASVRPEQTSGKCSSGYNDVDTSGYRGPGGMS